MNSNWESQFSRDRDSRFFYQLSPEERSEFEKVMKDDLYDYQYVKSEISEAMSWLVGVLVSFSVVASIFLSVSTSFPLMRTFVFRSAVALVTLAIAFRLTPLLQDFLLNTRLPPSRDE